MVGFGAACLIVAFVVALYALGAAIVAAVSGDRRVVDSPRRAGYGLCALRTICVVVICLPPGGGGGVGLGPPPPPAGEGGPPADALLRLRDVLDPVRVRDRGAHRPQARCELDPLDPTVRADRVALPHGRDPPRGAV